MRLDAGAVLAESGWLIASGGAFSRIDLTLYPIERVASREHSRALTRYTVIDNRRETRITCATTTR